MFALVLNGTVVQIADSQFPVAPELNWVDVALNPDNVVAGHDYDGRNFRAPEEISATPQQNRELSYPSLANFQETLYNSMVSGEIPPSKAFVSSMAKVQAQYPVSVDAEPAEAEIN